jgi:hypothetical protein
MSRLVITGPLPPDGEDWCAVCVADWKAELIASLGIDQAWVDANLSGPDSKVIYLRAKASHPMPPLAAAVTMAPVEVMGWKTVKVCWTHAAATRAVAPDPPPGFRRPPGLIPGMS